MANQELWKRMLVKLARHARVTPTVVKGHAGHPENERADRLAQDAAQLDWPDSPQPVLQTQTLANDGEQLGFDLSGS